MNFLFSIIVPVYNVEVYLPTCLDSIINQTYFNLEIIVVNDGSTDHSGKVIELYAQKDCRIKVITQENQGLSAARNVGMDNATGDYVMFVDSDDYISLDVCQATVDFIKRNGSLDIFQFARYRFDEKKQIEEKICWESTLIYAGKEFLEKAVINDYFYASACNKIYRTDFLKEHGFKFIRGIYHEDLFFVFQSLLCSKSIGMMPSVYYFYRITPASITNRMKEKDRDVLKTVSALEVFLRETFPAVEQTFYFKKLVYSWVASTVCFKYPTRYPLSQKANKIVKSILYDSVFIEYVKYFAYSKGICLKYKIPAWLSLNVYPLYVIAIYCFFNFKKLIKS